MVKKGKKCYRVMIKGLYEDKGSQALRFTDSKGNRRPINFQNKKDAENRLNLEHKRGGWKGKVVKC